MRYFIKQVISFFMVIISALAIVFLFLMFGLRENVVETAQQELIRYGQTIVDSGMDSREIVYGQQILGANQINVTIYTNDNIALTYDKDGLYATSGKTTLSKDDLYQLSQGIILRDPSEADHNDGVVVYYPIMTTSNEYVGFLRLSQSMEGIREDIASISSGGAIALLISGVVAIILAVILSNYHIRRINRLRLATGKIAQGDYQIDSLAEQSDHSWRRDEVDDLTDDFVYMAKELERSNAEVARHQQISEQMMQDVAHEMKTPLTTMNGLLEGLEYGMIPENRQQRSFELIKEETQRLIRLVEDNLDYEKIRTNQVALNPVLFHGQGLLNEVALQLSSKAKEKGTEIVISAPDDFMVYADRDRFKQIIFNIVNNSVQFTENGTIDIIAKNDEDSAWIKITDSGLGMDAEEVEQIWQRFYKADESRKNTAYGETGLGLSIVKQLVSIHNGDIEVESEKDIGTSFEIRLPLESSI